MSETNISFDEQFIAAYRVAIDMKLSRSNFAQLMGILPKSVMRKKQKLKASVGIELPTLSDDNSLDLSPKTRALFSDLLSKRLLKISKSASVNDVKNKIVVDIRKNERYVITSAQNASLVNTHFLAALNTYCQHNNAKLKVIKYRYKNPTSIWTNSSKNDEWWHNSLEEYLIDTQVKIGKNIRIMGDIKIQPTASCPLSGFDSISGLDSAIFGHPRIEFRSVPSLPGEFPKILTTTGSITLPNYTDSKAGHNGAMHHTNSAIILEIDANGTFHMRHVTYDETRKGFYDLDKFYHRTFVESNVRADGLVIGDVHAEHVSEEALNGLFGFGNGSVCDVVNPKNVFLHDLIDASARSHHTIRDSAGRFRKHTSKRNDNVEESLQICADLLKSIYRPQCKIHIVKSNHDEHIDRWLKEADPTLDPENAKFFYYMKYNQYKHIKERIPFDSFKFWASNPDEQSGIDKDVLKNVVFLQRNQNHSICGVEVSLHGDIGPNGTRGSLNSLSRMGQKLIIGHSHSPGIKNGSYQVGTTSKLDMDYVRGPSSWLHTSAIIYPDGNVSLINIINGEWTIK